MDLFRHICVWRVQITKLDCFYALRKGFHYGLFCEWNYKMWRKSRIAITKCVIFDASKFEYVDLLVYKIPKYRFFFVWTFWHEISKCESLLCMKFQNIWSFIVHQIPENVTFYEKNSFLHTPIAEAWWNFWCIQFLNVDRFVIKIPN